MFFISEFLKQILEYIFAFVGNYGWSVVLFTLLIRMVLLPLDIKSKKSMRRVTDLQPKVNALQAKYANDRDKLNQKMSELYRKEKVSPMSGCLPMLLSMPILFCMFDAMRVVANEHTVQMLLNMMNGTFDPAQMQSWLWIKNVYQPDSFLSTIIPAIGDQLSAIGPISGTLLTEQNLTLVREFLKTPEYAAIAAQMGGATYLYQAPMLFWTIQIPAQFNGLFLLPILAGVTQFLTTQLTTPANQTSQQQSQNAIMKWFFPLFSVWICATYNAAFSIYWVAVNIIMMVQQVVINYFLDKKSKSLSAPEEVTKP
ncbi:MAG: YidC/Oxa1 family membrane protein insertase [Clostridia bacterium]